MNSEMEHSSARPAAMDAVPDFHNDPANNTDSVTDGAAGDGTSTEPTAVEFRGHRLYLTAESDGGDG